VLEVTVEIEIFFDLGTRAVYRNGDFDTKATHSGRIQTTNAIGVTESGLALTIFKRFRP